MRITIDGVGIRFRMGVEVIRDLTLDIPTFAAFGDTCYAGVSP